MNGFPVHQYKIIYYKPTPYRRLTRRLSEWLDSPLAIRAIGIFTSGQTFKRKIKSTRFSSSTRKIIDMADSINNMPLEDVQGAIRSMEGYFRSCRDIGQGIGTKETVRYRELRERMAALIPDPIYEGDVVLINKAAWNDMAIKPNSNLECEASHYYDGLLFVWPIDKKFNGLYISKSNIIRKVRVKAGDNSRALESW
jgi:hypothetical protein